MESDKHMDMNQSRRDFLRTTGKGLLGVAAVSMLPVGLNSAAAEDIEAPAWPWKWEKLDPQEVMEAGYKAFYTHGGCCAGAFAAIIETLAAKFGYPYNQLNARMFANGAGGYGQQSLCGSLGGCCAIFGLFCEGSDAGALRNELYAWYKEKPFPEYQPEFKAPTTTVAGSVECRDSVNKYMDATGFTMADDGRKARCAAVTGETAAKAVEILNVHFGYSEAVVEETAEETTADNEFIGEATSEIGGPIKVKVTMDGDKIAKIEVLSHNETAGISDPAFKLADTIIANNSTEVDTVSGATKTSEAFIAAVNDALAKAGR
jgi:uncharacterized protein with FMN-binding domain